MPLPKGTKYRFKKYPSGKTVRLAFKPGSSKVIEAKSFVKKGEVLKEKKKARRKSIGNER